MEVKSLKTHSYSYQLFKSTHFVFLTHKWKIKSHYFQIKTSYYFKLTPTCSFQEEGQRSIHGFTVERKGERD